ncbi:MAG: hypothetical protein E7B03_02640 [Negativicoccus succinicivorans]|nr:hypothetical protein [Negativicoccus succinicivorans]
MQRQLLHLVLALVVALGASSGVVQAAASLSFGQMYAGSTVRGLVLSDYLQSLAGQEVEMPEPEKKKREMIQLWGE